MKIINLNYSSSLQYHDVNSWIDEYRFFYDIWEEVAKQHEVIFLEFINAEASFRHKGINFLFLKKSRFSLLFPLALNRFIAGQEPDVVIVHGLMYPLQTYLLRQALGENVRIVLQHHAEKPLQGWKYRIQRVLGPVADAYWFTGKGHAEPWIQKGLIAPQSTIDELMEVSASFRMIRREDARAVTGVDTDKSYLWVGRLNANKDPLLMVETFLQFAAKEPEARLYMIYQTEDLLGEIQQIIAKYPQQAGAIELLGKLPHDELAYWYCSCSYLVSCSHYESSGLALCEALSCGCIPLVTDIPSYNYMTRNICGLKFPVGDAAALMSVLEESLITDTMLSRVRAVQLFRENLSAKAIAERIQKLLASYR